MLYRLFRGVIKYIVYGNTFSSFGFGGVKGRQDQPGQNEGLHL